MSTGMRIVRALALSVLAGLLLAWATDQAGDGRTAVSELRNSLGALSAPWVIIPLLAGTICVRYRSAALLGLACTAAALSSWYLLNSVTEDLGAHGFLTDLRLEFTANRIYFEAGLVTGPLFGMLGAWWHRHRQIPVSVAAAALLLGEPLVLYGLSALHSSGVLSTSGPPEIRMVTNVSIGGAAALTAAVIEIALGALLLGWVVLNRRDTHER